VTAFNAGTVSTTRLREKTKPRYGETRHG